jgi:hypothetical protein
MALQQSETTLLRRVEMMDKLAVGKDADKAREILSLFSDLTAQLHKDTMAGDQDRIAQSGKMVREFVTRLRIMMGANLPSEIKQVGEDIEHAIEKDANLTELLS